MGWYREKDLSSTALVVPAQSVRAARIFVKCIRREPFSL